MTSGGANDPEFKSAELAFQQYGELPGVPMEWYHYHEACLASMRPVPQKRARAISEMRQVFDVLKATPRSNQAFQRAILKDIFLGTYNRQPGYPVRCDALTRTVRLYAKEMYKSAVGSESGSASTTSNPAKPITPG